MLEKNSLKDRLQREKDKMEQFKNLAAEKFTKAADKLVQNQWLNLTCHLIKKQGDTHLAVFLLQQKSQSGNHGRVSFVAARFCIFGHKSAEFALV